jgi:hypothetical protein
MTHTAISLGVTAWEEEVTEEQFNATPSEEED